MFLKGLLAVDYTLRLSSSGFRANFLLPLQIIQSATLERISLLRLDPRGRYMVVINLRRFVAIPFSTIASLPQFHTVVCKMLNTILYNAKPVCA